MQTQALRDVRPTPTIKAHRCEGKRGTSESAPINPTGTAAWTRGLPKRLPKLRSSPSTEQNSEHVTELKTPANNSDDLNSTRCKAVHTGSIPVVAFLFRLQIGSFHIDNLSSHR